MADKGSARTGEENLRFLSRRASAAGGLDIASSNGKNPCKDIYEQITSVL
jgi:hypothetical protein